MSSAQERWSSLLFIVSSVVLSAGAQLLMKVGMQELRSADIGYSVATLSEAAHGLSSAIAWVAAGLVCYAASMLFWLAALMKYELSLAYPMLSLSYVLVYLAAVFWPRLQETASLSKTIGILFILAGVFLVTRKRRE